MQTYMDQQYLLQTEQEDQFFRSRFPAVEELNRAVFSGDETALKSALHNLSEQVFPYYFSESIEISKLYLAEYIGALTAEGRRRGIPENITADLKKCTFEKLVAVRTREDMEQLTIRFLQQLFSLYRQHSVSQYSHLVQRAVELIHLKKMQPLSPSDVSDSLHVNRSYLSERFRRETGQTLTEYIHMAKIRQADILIRDRIYSLVEIADMLGYSSYRYFSRVYRKYTGHLPSDHFPEQAGAGGQPGESPQSGAHGGGDHGAEAPDSNSC